jgi:thymidylate synthase ThyX
MKRTAKKELMLVTPSKAYATRCIVKDLTGIEPFKRACESTTGRNMTKQSAYNLLKRMYIAEHSPIRCRLFFVEIKNIPTFVCNHFVRHKVGVEFFCLSHRSDRTGVKDELSNRLTPTSFSMLINAQALINIARKRLCYKASEETRNVMQLIKQTVTDIDPDLAYSMVPDCVYRGYCHEMSSCKK